MAVSKISPQPRLRQHGAEVLRFGTIRLLPVALAAEARGESAQLLNRVLADTTILYALYRKHHGVVAGPTFYQFHLLFDVGDPRHAAELSWIERPPDGAEEVPVMIGRLLAAHEDIITVVRAAIKKTAASGDWGSNDLLISDVLRHELQVWFLSAHLVDIPLVEA